MIEHYLFPSSSFASDIDGVINLIAVLALGWGALALLVFFWLCLKFKKKDGQKAMYISGEKPEEMRFISIPHNLVLLCDIVIIVAAVRVWVDVKVDTPPDVSATVRIIGQQWAWSFVHPGPDGKLDTADDIKSVDTLRLEVDKTYAYELQARDVMHSFSVPHFRLKQDAIPGRTITGWFKPTQTGVMDLQCAEMCGVGHGLMPGRVIVQTKEAHERWMGANRGSVVASR